MAIVDRKDAYKRLPVCDEREMLAVVTLKCPNSGEMRGLMSHAQLFGAAAAGLHCSAVSGPTAKITVSWLEIPRLGYPVFGEVTAESLILGALASFADLN